MSKEVLKDDQMQTFGYFWLLRWVSVFYHVGLNMAGKIGPDRNTANRVGTLTTGDIIAQQVERTLEDARCVLRPFSIMLSLNAEVFGTRNNARWLTATYATKAPELNRRYRKDIKLGFRFSTTIWCRKLYRVPCSHPLVDLQGAQNLPVL
jgi:hypothetical protein